LGFKGRYSSTNGTSATIKGSSFDNVPNEVLDLIISFIPGLNDSFITYQKNGSSRKIHQIIALMHVSRQFRFAMLQHKVWRDINFNFNLLVATASEDDYRRFFPSTAESEPVANLAARTTRLCNILFSDPYFREGIKKKTDWAFGSLEVLFAVIGNVPTFTESVQDVVLELDGIDVAIPRLFGCKNLARLEILGTNQRSMDMDHIGRFLPSLKILEITLPSQFSGSLKRVQGLEEFSLNCNGAYLDLETGAIVDHQSLLPIASTKTLTCLCLFLLLFLVIILIIVLSSISLKRW
jgi:hypothetical protein